MHCSSCRQPKSAPGVRPANHPKGLVLSELKYVIVSQSNDNCLQIYHLFAFLELKDNSLNLARNSSSLIG